MPSRIVRSLSMHSTVMPESCTRSTSRASRGSWLTGAVVESGTSSRELRSAADRRDDRNLVVENARDPFHDREAEAKATRHLGALLEAMELLEDRPFLRRRNAEPGVVDADPQPPAAPPATDQDAAGRRVLDGVRNEVLQHPRNNRRSDCTASELGTNLSRNRFSCASGANSTSSWRNRSPTRKLTISGFIAPVSRREMSSSAPKISSTASSEASMLPTSCASSPSPCRSTRLVT